MENKTFVAESKPYKPSSIEQKLVYSPALGIVEPRIEQRMELYGKIDLYSAEKSFGPGKCCMCCK